MSNRVQPPASVVASTGYELVARARRDSGNGAGDDGLCLHGKTPTSPVDSTTSTATQASRSSTAPATVRPGPPAARISLSGKTTIRKPAGWFTARYHGLPGTLGSPLLLMSSASANIRCDSHEIQKCSSTTWFPPGVRTPTDGVLVIWMFTVPQGAPGARWSALPGTATTIHGHPAKIHFTAIDTTCPAGVAREFQATVQIRTRPISSRLDTGQHFVMTACFGAHAASADVAATRAMLRSLHIDPTGWS